MEWKKTWIVYCSLEERMPFY